MPAIKKQRPHFLNHEMYHHDAADRSYTRIIGAIVWPGERPGFAVVLCEEFLTPNIGPRFHWLNEAQETSHNDLIKRCVELQSDLCVMQWYAREDPAADELLAIHNSQAFDKRSPTLHVVDPSQVNPKGLITVQLEILREHLDPRRKSIKLSAESKLPGLLQELPPLVSDVRDYQFPGPAALCYALSELVTRPYQFPEIESQEEYDPLNYRRNRNKRRLARDE